MTTPDFNTGRPCASELHPQAKKQHAWVQASINFGFIRGLLASSYRHNGNVSVDPEVLLKLMFLLFSENVRSERELMRRLPGPEGVND